MTLNEAVTTIPKPLRGEPAAQAASGSKSRRTFFGRRLLRLARVALLISSGLLVLLYFFQSSLIFPGASTQGKPIAQVTPGPDAELLRLTTNSGERIAALYGRALASDGKPDPAATDRPTMIYFYGNGMCLNQAAPEFNRFRRLGLNVVIPEYVGYGMSEGKPSEIGCRATAETVYDFLASARRIKPESIVCAGWSLGGAVAIDLAFRRQVGGLIVFSTFTSAVEVARHLVPFVPVSLLLQSCFESLRKIATIRCPVLVGHGTRDPIIPFWMEK